MSLFHFVASPSVYLSVLVLALLPVIILVLVGIKSQLLGAGEKGTVAYKVENELLNFALSSKISFCEIFVSIALILTAPRWGVVVGILALVVAIVCSVCQWLFSDNSDGHEEDSPEEE